MISTVRQRFTDLTLLPKPQQTMLTAGRAAESAKNKVNPNVIELLNVRKGLQQSWPNDIRLR